MIKLYIPDKDLAQLKLEQVLDKVYTVKMLHQDQETINFMTKILKKDPHMALEQVKDLKQLKGTNLDPEIILLNLQ